MWRLRHPQPGQGLVGAWCPSRDAARGTVRLTDRSPYRNHGTLTNMTADDWVISHGAGGGYALDFDVTNDYILLDSRQYLTAGNPFTLCWWEYVTGTTQSYPARFRLKSSTNTWGVLRGKAGTGYDDLSWGEWRGVSGNKMSFLTTGNAVGLWVHIAIVGKLGPDTNVAANWAAFVDGVEKTVAVTSGPFSSFSGSMNHIGYDLLDNGPECLMDDIRLYNRCLTPSEISLLHRIGRGGAYALEYVPIGKAGAAPPSFKAAWLAGARQTKIIGGGVR